MKKIAVLFIVSSCTTLGPNPATTGVSAVPVGQPAIEGQIGPVPAFHLSQSTKNSAAGAPVFQVLALLELDRFIRLPGLIFGGRLFGGTGDTLLEPYLGYRTKLGDRFAIGGGVYGTAKRSTVRLASYHGTRIGGEAQFDAKLWHPLSWFQLHAQVAIQATRIFASGTYCVDPMGLGKDCNEEMPMMNTMVSGEQEGVYPAATTTLGFDLGRDQGRRFRGARIALLGAIGTMPLVENGVKVDSGVYGMFGATLSLSLGLADGDDTVDE